ncbi:MAG: GyrI-like domain-containing protein [Fusobacteriaceae bacterium]|jgi:hypothetical protein|nr:GyrI-like domain-containing protein [Fusobacteriaceae bacterium]MBP6467080.1 GyrI-like domain-containing protein [Fusobacteriaceae bacterium]MBP9595699.1 GyrI-like domain-containing protein [Fusobacteriaceae bacterium]MBU9917465.1 GyrI-like domain-containing protein [Fusobacteriaceae bacterium]
MEKYEWKKKEKNLYLPKAKPEIIDIPSFKFFTLEGKGNPNDEFFADYVGALYSLSYGVKMSYKKGIEPKGFYDYIVYPLEGVWDLTEKGREDYKKGFINKEELLFKLMIRQPDFVDEAYAKFIVEEAKKNKPNALLNDVKFEEIEEGKVVQMLHVGSYDSEVESFKIMEEFVKESGFERAEKLHKEIYLSDARKVEAEKLKTILRFKVK